MNAYQNPAAINALTRWHCHWCGLVVASVSAPEHRCPERGGALIPMLPTTRQPEDKQ